MSLGERIKDEREKLGLTQEGLARAIEVNSQQVSKWERGIVRSIRVRHAVALARVTGQAVQYYAPDSRVATGPPELLPTMNSALHYIETIAKRHGTAGPQWAAVVKTLELWARAS